MARSTRTLAPVLLTLLAACASGPPPAPAPPAPLVAPDTPGAVIEISLKQGWARPQAPAQVWFARVSALNGSDCTPRAAEFDPALDRATSVGTGTSGSLSMMGTLEGSTIPGDPTCMYDELGNPIWDPILYTATRIEGTRAYLDAPPPGRYAAVAVQFGAGDHTNTLYFSKAMIAATEVPLPAGAARHMGRYTLRAGSGGLDDAQQQFRERIEPPDPSMPGVIVGAVIAGILSGGNGGGDQGPSHLHQPAAVVRSVTPPAPEASPTYPW